MINRFREYILYIVGADLEGKYNQKQPKISRVSRKELKRIEKESGKPEKVAISRKKLEKRETPEEYIIDNLLMEVDPEIPKPKKFSVNNVILSEEQRLLYHFRFLNYTDKSYDLLKYALKNNLSVPEKFNRFSESLSIKGERLYFRELPILYDAEIQTLVREAYFNTLENIMAD